MTQQQRMYAKRTHRTSRGLICGLGVLATFVLHGCGSEQDKDRAIKSPPSPPRPSSSPRPRTDADGLGQRRPVQIGVPGGTQGPGGGCIAPMNVELLLDPSSQGEPQSYLVARLEQSCYERATAKLRLKVDGGVRLGAGLSCQRTTDAKFNFECSLDPRTFVFEDTLLIPIQVSSQASPSFLAEIELLGSQTPSQSSSPAP